MSLCFLEHLIYLNRSNLNSCSNSSDQQVGVKMLKELFMELSKEAKLREIQNYIRARDNDYGFCGGEKSHSIHPCFSVCGMEKVIHEMEDFYWINDRTIYVTYKPEYTKWRNVIYRLTYSPRETQEEYYFVHPLTNDEAAAFVNEHLKLFNLERAVSFNFGDDRLQAFEKLEELYTKIKNGQGTA
jgi:hypothetical protein